MTLDPAPTWIVITSSAPTWSKRTVARSDSGVLPNCPPPSLAMLSSLHEQMLEIIALWLNIALSCLHCMYYLPAFCISAMSCPGNNIAPSHNVRPPKSPSVVGEVSLKAIYGHYYQH